MNTAPGSGTLGGATVAAIQPFRVVHEHVHVHVHGVTFAEVLPCRVERAHRYVYVPGRSLIPRREATCRAVHPSPAAFARAPLPGRAPSGVRPPGTTTAPVP